MHSSTTTEIQSSSRSSRDVRRRNYAPNTVPNQGVTDTQRLYQERQAKHQPLPALPSDYTPKTISNKEKQKREARAHYSTRRLLRSKRYAIEADVPPRISPYLNLTIFMNLTTQQRIDHYNSRHKCEHGRAFSSYRIAQDVLIDGTLVPKYISLACTCPLEPRTPHNIEDVCGHCNHKTFIMCKATGHLAWECRNCHFMTYTYTELQQKLEPTSETDLQPILKRVFVRQRTHYINEIPVHDSSREVVPIQPTLKQWATVEQTEAISLAEQATVSAPKYASTRAAFRRVRARKLDIQVNLPEREAPTANVRTPYQPPKTQAGVRVELGKREFGLSDITGPVKSLYQNFLNLFSQVSEDVSNIYGKAVGTAKTAAMTPMLDKIKAFFQTLIEHMMNNPFVIGYQAWRLAMTNSNLERAFLIAAICQTTALRKLINYIFRGLGLAHLMEFENAAQYEKSIERDVNDAADTIYALLRHHYPEADTKKAHHIARYIVDNRLSRITIDGELTFAEIEQVIAQHADTVKNAAQTAVTNTNSSAIKEKKIIEETKKKHPALFKLREARDEKVRLQQQQAAQEELDGIITLPSEEDDKYLSSNEESGERQHGKLPTISEEDEDSLFVEEHGYRQFGASLFYALFNLPTNLWQATSILESLKTFNTVCSGWRNIHELMTSFVEFLPSWMTSILVATDPKKRFAHDARTPGNPINVMVMGYQSLLELGTVEAFTNFEKAWKESETYILKNYNPITAIIAQQHRYYLQLAKSILNPAISGVRPIPFVVTLHGKPKSGKSTAWPAMLSKIVGGLSVQAIRQLAYIRNTSSEYWDGYSPEKHKIVVWDDFGQQKDDDCGMELISLVSPANFLPPFASLNDPSVGLKGTPVDSPIVVLCTNMDNFRHISTVVCPAAIERRLNIEIDVDHLWTPSSKYMVSRRTAEGTKVPINKMDMSEIQNFLADEYEKHFATQTLADELLNSTLAQPKYNFLEMYNKVRKTQNVETGKQQSLLMAVARGIGYASAITCLNVIIDEIDEQYRSWGMAFLAIGATLAGLYILLNNFGSQESGQSSTPKAEAPLKYGHPVSFGHRQVGNQNDQGVINRLMNNSVAVSAGPFYINALFLRGRQLLINKHFLDEVGEHPLTIYSSRAVDDTSYTVNLSDCTIKRIANTDLCVVELPNNVAPYCDVTKYIANSVPQVEQECYVTRRDFNTKRTFVYTTRVQPGYASIVVNERDGTNTVTTDNILYHYEHAAGDCGSLIMTRLDGNMQLVGFHTIGSNSNAMRSFGIALNRDEILSNLSTKSAAIARDDRFPYEEVTYEHGTGPVNKIQHVVTTTQRITNSGKTKLIPSTLFDLVSEHTTEPALLYNVKGVDPWITALSKYGKCTDQFPHEVTARSVDSIITELQRYASSLDLNRTLTMDEAINGIPGRVESMKLNTSAGYPASLDPRLRGGKQNLVSGVDGERKLTPQAQEHYEYWEECLTSDLVPTDPYIATLKDERRAIAKVKLGKTRLFAAGSMAGYLHNKREFGGFCEFFQRTRGNTFSTLGLNRGSIEWHEMILRMKEVSNYGFDGDQEEWDGRLKASIALELARVFDAFYGPRHSRRRLILIMQAVFAYLRIDAGDIHGIYLIAGCMPSGWFLTFVLNCLVNAVLFRNAWQVLIMAPYNDLYHFRKFVRDNFAGDDNILAVAQAFLTHFNAVTIAAYFDKYGQKMTPATKGGELIAFQPIEDCSFLKTKTGRLFEKYVPHFDRVANLETLNWISRCADVHAATVSNCNDVLRNVFFYGEAEFNELRDKIHKFQPHYDLISFWPLKAAFLGYGQIPDPYGTFGYTRTQVNDASILYGKRFGVPRSLTGASNDAATSSEHTQTTMHTSTTETGKRQSGLTTEQPVAHVAVTPGAAAPAVASLDDSTPTITSRQGVHLSEQQTTTIMHSFDGNHMPGFSRAAAHLNEASWDLEQMLLRNNLVGSFPWNMTDAVGTELAILPSITTICDVPTDLLQNDLVSAPFERFMMFRCRQIRIRFQLTASRFHQGQLLIYYVPTMLPKREMQPFIFSPRRASQVEHVYFDPSKGDVVEMLIPFVHQKGWLDLIHGDVLGQIRIKVLNQLLAATGASTTVECKVFVSVEGAQFKIPRPGGLGLRARLEREAERQGFTLVPRESGKRQSGGFERIGAAVGGELDALAASIIPSEITGAVAGVCLDAPIISSNPPVITNKDAQYMSHSRGAVEGERMTLEPSAQFITTDQFNSKVDETDIMYLCGKENFLGTVPWSSTQAVGTILWDTIVSPTHLISDLRVPPQYRSPPFTPTTLGYIASLFTNWRGGLRFTFKVVGTSLHEGRLDASNHPFASEVPTDYNVSQSQYVESKTLRNEDNFFSVIVPHLSGTPWLRIWNGEDLSSDVSDDHLALQEFAHGALSLRVGVPLKAPANVVSNVDINIFVSAAEDFQVHALTIHAGRFTIPTGPGIVERHRKRRLIRELQDEVGRRQSGERNINTVTKNDADAIALSVSRARTYDPGVRHFGETYTNLRECMKRYQHFFSEDIFGLQRNVGTVNRQPQKIGGIFSHMCNMFRLIRGPMRFKTDMNVVSTSGGNTYDTRLTGFISYTPYADFNGGTIAPIGDSLFYDAVQRIAHPPMVRFSPTHVAEFELPMTTNYHSAILDNDALDSANEYYVNQFYHLELIYGIEKTVTTNVYNATFHFEIAFADETRLGMFIGCPDIVITPSAEYPLPAVGVVP